MPLKCFKTYVFTMMALLLTACSASIEEYENQTPAFNLFEYFEGEVHAWGMIRDSSGRQTRRFSVIIHGEIEHTDTFHGSHHGGVLTLTEDFLFDDGEIQQRVWQIVRLTDGTYRGTADDVVGQARGETAGNALNWRYVLRVPVGESTYDIKFDDWMYRQDELRVFNIATMTKWGITVGEVTLFFEKQQQPAPKAIQRFTAY